MVTVYVYDDDDFFLATLNGDEFIGSFTVTEPTDGLITIGGRYTYSVWCVESAGHVWQSQ